ncbi:MAG TPA: hypothetical protein VGB85_09890 [Nannocystis sp.]
MIPTTSSRFMLPGFALVAGLVVMSGTARAGNGIHPRTPVKWEPEPACMTIVDRSVDAKLTFNYSIPYEDTRPDNAVDEVEDSRRHQFIAFCHGHSVQQPLPVWLSMADVDAAKGVGIIDMGGVAAEDILELNPEWKDCFTRITADDARREILFAEANKPVVWDTTGLAAGAYIVSGYTWEPVFNIWSVRPGVVKVVDDPDPAKNGPALAITNRNEVKYGDEVLMLTGCVDAMDGSTITGYWSLTDNADVLDWKPFAAGTPVSGDSFELPFMAPPEAVGGPVTIKIEITDPMDRKFTAHMLTLADFLQGSAGESGDCSDTGNFIGMPGCEGSDDGGGTTGGDSSGPGVTSTGTPDTTPTTAATGTTGEGGSSEETGTTPQTGEGSCGGCTLGGGGVPAVLLGPWLLWATRRRR